MEEGEGREIVVCLSGFRKVFFFFLIIVLTWKIVRVSEVSVLCIYIYIY